PLVKGFSQPVTGWLLRMRFPASWPPLGGGRLWLSRVSDYRMWRSRLEPARNGSFYAIVLMNIQCLYDVNQ
ncbi:hypothetical protein, partial [Craterilacuibacter sp.]|uniref:hypothetical protein n=1 Tax=Craterilacuibacter sp. TaxID=2870909 RepID=UPI003F347009